MRKVIVPTSLILATLGAASFSYRGARPSVVAVLLSLVLLAVLLDLHRMLARSLAPPRPSPPPSPPYPSITVIRPVRGKDVGAAENFAAALDPGYPGEVETLFVFDDEDDPGLEAARRAVADHRAAGRPGRAEVLVAGPPPPGMTGKLHAMDCGQRAARGTLIAFGDSDTRPDRQVLAGVVEALLATDASCAFAPIVVDQPPRKLGDVFYALMQNALYAPLAATAAGKERELPFVMGQLMVFRREALAAIGGVAVARGQLVDDMYLGRRLHELGRKNRMSEHRLSIATGGLSLRDFLPIYRCWMTFGRNGLTIGFTWPQWMQGIILYTAIITFALAIAGGHRIVALAPLAVLVAQTASLLSLNRRNGGAPIPSRWAWAPFLLVLLGPIVLAVSLLRRQVTWRGRVYKLDVDASLTATR